MKIPKITKILILGGDSITLEILPLLKKSFNYLLLCSKRNLDSKINEKRLEDHLIKMKANYKKVNNLDKSIDFNKDYNSKKSLYLCMSSPWIIKKNDFKKIKSLILNSHSTRLPQYRGGATFSWLVMNKVRFGFNNLYIIDKNIDTGKIIFFEEFLYPNNLKTPDDYFQIYKKKQMEFLNKKLLNFRKKKNTLVPTKQLEYLSSYFPRLNSNIHGWVDWSLDYNDLYAFINSFGNPHEGCSTYYKSQKVLIKDASPNHEDAKFNSYKNGIIFRKGPNWVCVAANNGSIIIEKVIYKKQNIIHKLRVGDRLFTPLNKIENKFKRVFYNPKGLVKK